MRAKLLCCVLAGMACMSLSSCQDDEENGRKVINQEVYELTIASSRVPGSVYSGCGNNYVWDVLAGKKGQSGEWVAYSDIPGLDYMPGNEYRIQLESTTYEDHQMAEPVWTEYRLQQVLSKEAKQTAGLPQHLLSKEYYETGTFVPEYRFAVDAAHKEQIEKDLKENPPFMANANVIIYGGQLSRWIAIAKDGKMLGNGNIKHLNVEFSSFPESYKLLPLNNVQGTQRWTFMDNDNKETVTYDAFIGSESRSRDILLMSMSLWFYKDVTDIYKAKYPDAGVKTVVYSLGLVMK